jgi:biotin carboxylase
VIARRDAPRLARATRALTELEIEGIPTTRAAALDILGSREFATGSYSTSTVDDLVGRVPSLSRQ